MSRGEITLKSGAVVVFDAEVLEWSRDEDGRELAWDNPAWATRTLLHIDVGEIAAVVFLED